jgi:Flp pilus assembly protein protease CpaA
MPLIQPEKWPFWVICLVMLGAAWGNDRSLAMRNVVTLPFILTGWALGLAHSLGGQMHGGSGSLVSSLACTAIPLFLSLPFYVMGMLGAGSVKLQMGYGAWVGAFLGFELGVATVLEATLGAALVLLALALIERFQRKEEDRWPLLPTGLAQFICGTTALVWTLMV